MKAVILAAGKSTRTYPLTLTRPKPLLPVSNICVLKRNLSSLKGLISDAIIIVGYKKEMIIDAFSDSFEGISLTYIEQKEQKGTAHALFLAQKHIKGRFLLLLGDDLYSKKDIKKCLSYDHSILAAHTKTPELFGILKEKDGIVLDLIEKPKEHISHLMSTGLMVLSDSIFDDIKSLKPSVRGELELPDAIRHFIKREKIHSVLASSYYPIGYPWDLLKADIAIRDGENSIGKGCKITGKIINSSIGEDCVIEGDVTDSIVMNGSRILKGSSVYSSIIGEGCVIDGTLHSSSHATSLVNGKKIVTGEFGCAVGDFSTLSKAMVSPGVKINPRTKTQGVINSDLL